MKIQFFALILLFALSCEQKSSNKVETDAYESSDYEVVGFPVKIHYMERNGMEYMIASGSYGEAGVSICNLTLDSLQVEFYKKSLK